MTDILIDRDIAFFVVGVLEGVSWEVDGQAKRIILKARDHILGRAGIANPVQQH